jgi:ABC-type uncharacterized transport system permease subunit
MNYMLKEILFVVVKVYVKMKTWDSDYDIVEMILIDPLVYPTNHVVVHQLIVEENIVNFHARIVQDKTILELNVL